MLRVAREIGARLGVTVRTSFLGAHALPPEYAGRADDYVEAACGWLRELHAQGLVDAVDAFCEGIGFSPAQTRRVFETARALGLPVKLHATSSATSAAPRWSPSSAACPPTTSSTAARTRCARWRAPARSRCCCPAPSIPARDEAAAAGLAARARRADGGVHRPQPGTSPLLSLRLAMSLACTHFRLTPAEALRGATVHAARALGLGRPGKLAVGLRADFARWRVRHPSELAYWLDGGLLSELVLGGRNDEAPRGGASLTRAGLAARQRLLRGLLRRGLGRCGRLGGGNLLHGRLAVFTAVALGGGLRGGVRTGIAVVEMLRLPLAVLAGRPCPLPCPWKLFRKGRVA
jgi:imidazolonepropionase